MIGKPRPDLLTLFTTFYDLAVSRNPLLKAEMRQFDVLGTEVLNDASQITLQNNDFTEIANTRACVILSEKIEKSSHAKIFLQNVTITLLVLDFL